MKTTYIKNTAPNLNLQQIEIEAIALALKKHKGKRNLAAEELGISERILYRKTQEYKHEIDALL